MAEHNWRLLSIILSVFFNEAWSPEPPSMAVVDDEDAFPMCLLFAWSGVSRIAFVDDESLSLVALFPAWSGVSAMRRNFCVEDIVDVVRRRFKHFQVTKQLNVA